MKKNQQLIDNPRQLDSLSVMPGFRTPGAGRIVLQDAQLPKDTLEQWSSDLNRGYFACGCAYASAGLVIGVAIAAVLYFLNMEKASLSYGILLVLPIAGLVLGKFVGLIIAQSRLNEKIRVIQESWSKHYPITLDDWACG